MEVGLVPRQFEPCRPDAIPEGLFRVARRFNFNAGTATSSRKVPKGQTGNSPMLQHWECDTKD